MAKDASTPKPTKAQRKAEETAKAVRDMEAIAGGRFVDGKFVANP